MMAPMALAQDIVVVGEGITGLSTVFHLHQLGVRKVALVAGTDAPSSRQAAGIIAGGQVDNFTRVSHAHGAAFARDLWRFGDLGFDALAAFAKTEGLPLSLKERVRLITSEPELDEAKKAVAELQAAGLSGALRERKDLPLGPRVLAVQSDGNRGGFVNAAAVLKCLESKLRVPRLPPVVALDAGPSGVRLALADGQQIQAELVVVAAHLGTKTLIPELANALVSYADQWSEIRLAVGQSAGDLKGLAFSANHTYEWGAFTSATTLRLGGGRYLRPLAGIESTKATVDAKITMHLLDQLAKTFPFAAGAEALTSVGLLDIRPCDELPVIGPMYGSGRLLVATGYMGSGLTLGFQAGKCLAELIQNGKSDSLPRRLWPERLRTLEP